MVAALRPVVSKEFFTDGFDTEMDHLWTTTRVAGAWVETTRVGNDGFAVLSFYGIAGANACNNKRFESERLLLALLSHLGAYKHRPIFLCMDANLSFDKSDTIQPSNKGVPGIVEARCSMSRGFALNHRKDSTTPRGGLGVSDASQLQSLLKAFRVEGLADPPSSSSVLLVQGCTEASVEGILPGVVGPLVVRVQVDLGKRGQPGHTFRGSQPRDRPSVQRKVEVNVQGRVLEAREPSKLDVHHQASCCRVCEHKVNAAARFRILRVDLVRATEALLQGRSTQA